jgi:ATP-binding cassette subfamily B protein
VEEKMLKRFIAYYKPHSGMLTLDMLASLVIALVGMVYPIITETMLRRSLTEHKLLK